MAGKGFDQRQGNIDPWERCNNQNERFNPWMNQEDGGGPMRREHMEMDMDRSRNQMGTMRGEMDDPTLPDWYDDEDFLEERFVNEGRMGGNFTGPEHRTVRRAVKRQKTQQRYEEMADSRFQNELMNHQEVSQKRAREKKQKLALEKQLLLEGMSRLLLPIPDLENIEGSDVDKFLYCSTLPSKTPLFDVAEVCPTITCILKGLKEQLAEGMIQMSVHSLERMVQLVKELFGLIQKTLFNAKNLNMNRVSETGISPLPVSKEFQKENASEALQNSLPCVKNYNSAPQLLSLKENKNSFCQSLPCFVESDVRVPTTIEEMNNLCELHARTKEKLDIIVKKIERLQTEQRTLKQAVPQQEDAETDPKMIENDKLQDALGEQVCRLMRTLHSLERGLKNSEHLHVKPPQQSATSTNQVCAARVPEPVCRRVSSEMPEPQLTFKRNVSLQPCRFIDDNDQFCIFCNQVFPLTTDLLNHLHKNHSHDMEHVAPTDRPWTSLKHMPKLVAEGDGSWLPLQGVEFLIPCSAFFCNLCKDFYGDVVTARSHLESEKHNLSYDKFRIDNPMYVENMEEVRKAKRRGTVSHGSKLKGTEGVKNPSQKKILTSDGKAPNRIISRNLLSKPAVNSKLSNPDVVSDILDMMSHDSGSIKTASPAVSVRCVKEVSGTVEVSLIENQEIECQFSYDAEKELSEAVANIPTSLLSPNLNPPAVNEEDCLNIEKVTGNGRDITRDSVQGDPLREAMECYGKKMEIQSILRSVKGRGQRCAQASDEDAKNKPFSNHMADANNKLAAVCKSLTKCLTKEKLVCSSWMKYDKLRKTKRSKKNQQRLASISSGNESPRILKSDVLHPIMNLVCSKNDPEGNLKELIVSPKAEAKLAVEMTSFSNEGMVIVTHGDSLILHGCCFNGESWKCHTARARIFQLEKKSISSATW